MNSDIKLIDSNRLKCKDIITEAEIAKNNNDFELAEKLYLKGCRIAEAVYQKTTLNKDSLSLIDYYARVIEFYKEQNNLFIAQKWYQKILGTLHTTCASRFVLEDYHTLMNWYLDTFEIMITNEDYASLNKHAKRMLECAKTLYLKEVTNQNLKYLLFARLMLGLSYLKNGELLKSYHHYYLTSIKMNRLYNELKDEGIKNDLISIYESLYDITNRHIFKIIARRWKIKILLLKEK